MITGLMIDSREPPWCQQLKFGGLPTVVTMLEQGDIMAATDTGEMILIERKTVSDLLGSVRDGRLFEQVSRMVDQTRWTYLVVTEPIVSNSNGQVVATGRGETGWSYAAIQGALLTAQELGAFVYFCKDGSEYEETVLKIGNRDRKNQFVLMPVKEPRLLSAGEQILASLPGIGIERIDILLKECSTPAWALSFLTDDISKIKGIPANVKTKVRAALKLKDDEQLAVITDGQGNEILSIEKLGFYQ